MVRRCQLFTALLLYGTILFAHAGQLILNIDKTETELGMPISADLYAVASKQNLADIDLDALQRSYGVVIKESVSDTQDPRWPEQPVQHLQMLLYPTRTGTQELPSLVLGEAKSAAREIHVIDGSTRQGGIRFNTGISSTAVWQRQQILVTVTINTPDRYVSLQAETPANRNVDIIPIPPRREFNADGGSTLQTGWALFPLSPGQQRINLPAIEYRLGGVVQRKYYLPALTLKVRALPAYLPPTIPVGRISVSSELTSRGLLQPQRLSYWQIRLQGDKISPMWMPPVLRQLKSDQSITFLPARSERKLGHTTNGIQAEVIHEVPFKLAGNGRSRLPEIRVQYFDPETARLETVRHQPQQRWVIGMGWRILFGLLLLALAAISAKKIHDGWAAWRSRSNARRSALASIDASVDTVTLREALRQFANAEGWPANLSLRDWLACWAKHYTGADDMPALIETLSRSSYDRDQADDINTLKTKMHAALLQARRIHYGWFARKLVSNNRIRRELPV